MYSQLYYKDYFTFSVQHRVRYSDGVAHTRYKDLISGPYRSMVEAFRRERQRLATARTRENQRTMKTPKIEGRGRGRGPSRCRGSGS